MVNWLSNGAGDTRRIEALEREIEGLKAKLSPMEARVRDDSEEFAKMRTSVLSVMAAETERIGELSTAVGVIRKALADLEEAASPDAISDLKERMKENREDAGKMRTAILRIERQLDHYAEEARRTSVGLLERIETMRRGLNGGGTPDPTPKDATRSSSLSEK